jgi:hypothetical protein
MGPLESLRADIRGSVMFGVLGGLAIAVGTAVAMPVGGGITSSVVTATVAGLTCGAAGFVAVSQAVAFMAIGPWLDLSGRGPVRLMTFLEFGRKRDLLRCAGSAYQFRHNELQRYLAD